MLRLCSVILVGAVALASAAPAGKVVRVERARGIRTVPRVCEVQPLAKVGNCLGSPAHGETVALIDEGLGSEQSRVIGEFRVDESTPSPDIPYACSGVTPTVFRITGNVVSGDKDQIANAGRVIGLRNVSIDARVARVMKEQIVPGTREVAHLALDLDGNGKADYLLYRYGCDETGNNAPQRADERLCFDTYLERGGRLVKVHTETLTFCH